MNPAKRVRLHSRNERIKESFLQIKNQRKFTNEFIFDKLAEQFYLSPKTVERIIFTKS